MDYAVIKNEAKSIKRFREARIYESSSHQNVSQTNIHQTQLKI